VPYDIKKLKKFMVPLLTLLSRNIAVGDPFAAVPTGL
jgi:hypothetical protein